MHNFKNFIHTNYGDNMYYINCFWIYSIIGFLLETICYTIFKWSGESGILYGPWTPLYGFGAVIIILTTKYVFRNFKGNKFLKLFLIFIFNFIFLSFIELVGGLLIEKLFSITWWDYSSHKYHLGKYVCLDMSLLWSLASIILIYIIKSIMDKLINKIPNFIGIIMTTIIAIDFIITIINKINLK